MTRLDIFIPGVPKPKGSWRAITSKTTGKAFLVPNDAKSKSWEQTVRGDVMGAWTGPLVQTAVCVSIGFYMPRRKKDYRTGRRSNELRDDVPLYHITTPDLDKLVRCVLDALTGVMLRDDSLVAEVNAFKVYSEEPGVRIVVEEL